MGATHRPLFNRRSSQAFRLAISACWLASALAFGQASTATSTTMAADPPAAPSSTASSSPACNHDPEDAPKPFTATQRWCYYGRRLISPTGIMTSAFMAGIQQAQDDPEEWPQGAEGYGMRFGSSLAQGATRKTGTFISQAIFREDPRMFRSHQHGFWKRTGHSVLNIFTATPANDPGNHRRFSPSYILGSVASGFVGRAWYPPSKHSVSDAWQRSGTALGGVAITSFLHEFEIDKKITGWITRRQP
ncbi:MAG: hypothetical protein M3P27_07170 [Acidobacteriota bacterium]|nr:hypothetical protein [Acidobacteriota bacterium]